MDAEMTAENARVGSNSVEEGAPPQEQKQQPRVRFNFDLICNDWMKGPPTGVLKSTACSRMQVL